MLQQIAVITVGIEDITRSKRFYRDGFDWKPVFENEEIVFYQMNGLILATWLSSALCKDMQRPASIDARPPFALAHNVHARTAVEPLMTKLVAAGGTLLRSADEPPHGGFRGYVADPDSHAWEIAWNPAWPIDEHGHVTFKI